MKNGVDLIKIVTLNKKQLLIVTLNEKIIQINMLKRNNY